MTHLQRLELQVLELHSRLSLRPTLETAGQVGALLEQARPLVAHGEWVQWLKRIGLSRQSASDYMAVSRHMEAGNVRPAGHITIKQFLSHIRSAKKAERATERDRFRQDVADRGGKLPDGVTLVNADCHSHDWPSGLDAIATDPPWSSMDDYRWLAKMAADD